MKRNLIRFGIAAVAWLASPLALAQAGGSAASASPPSVTTNDKTAQSDPSANSVASSHAAATQPSAPRFQSAPAPQSPVTTYTAGQWVYTSDHGWIWVPTGAVTVPMDGMPYVYLFTPSYGWGWYVSPWGWGPYYHGPWVWHAWRPYIWYGWAPRPYVFFHVGPHRWRRW